MADTADAGSQEAAAAAAVRAKRDETMRAIAAEIRLGDPVQQILNLPRVRPLAATLVQQWWTLPSQAAAGEAAEVAKAAAARSCANLRCPNLGTAGGPAAGQGAAKRCSACRVARYW